VRAYLSQSAEGNEPSLAAAHWRLGLILEKEGHKDQAKQELQEALQLDPSLEAAKQDLKRLQ
jgi:tetratricopeptide (TPR) repeat protein